MTDETKHLRIRVNAAMLVALDKRAKKSRANRSDVARKILADGLGCDGAVKPVGAPKKTSDIS